MVKSGSVLKMNERRVHRTEIGGTSKDKIFLQRVYGILVDHAKNTIDDARTYHEVPWVTCLYASS